MAEEDDPYDFSGAPPPPDEGDDPYDFSGASAAPAAFGGTRAGAGGVSSVRRRLQPPVTAAAMKQTIGAVGVARRGEEVQAALACEASAHAAQESAARVEGSGSSQAAMRNFPPALSSGAGSLLSNAHEDEAFDAELSTDESSAVGAPAKARGPAAACAACQSATAPDVTPTAASRDEAMALRARLARAQERRADLADRCAAAIAAIAEEQSGQAAAELRRRVDSVYARLATKLEGTPGMPEARLAADPEVSDAEDQVVMLQQRLRDAKAVLKRQTDKVYLLRQNRELYEGAAVPPPARPATAAAGSTTASRGGAGSGGPMKQKKLSQEDQAAMVKRLESYAVRKRENEARARAELDKASVEVARRRLSQDEQMGMVKRLEEHAKRRQAAQQRAQDELDQQADAAASRRLSAEEQAGLAKRLYAAKVSQARQKREEEEHDRQRADLVGAGRPRDHPKARAARAVEKLEQRAQQRGAGVTGGDRVPLGFESVQFPSEAAEAATAAASRYGDVRQETPRTKLSAGKMLTAEERESLRAAAQREAQSSSCGQTHGTPRGEQFELTVPPGYKPGDDLAVQLPDGRTVAVEIPSGVHVGGDFIALIPPAL